MRLLSEQLRLLLQGLPVVLGHNLSKALEDWQEMPWLVREWQCAPGGGEEQRGEWQCARWRRRAARKRDIIARPARPALAAQLPLNDGPKA